MLGYCDSTRAYKLMCLETKKIIKSRDVTFFEDMEDSEKCPSGRNEGSDHMVDSFPKSNQEEGIKDDLEDDEDQEDLEDGEKHVEAPSAPSGSLKAFKAKEVAPKPPNQPQAHKKRIRPCKSQGIHLGCANPLESGGRTTSCPIQPQM